MKKTFDEVLSQVRSGEVSLLDGIDSLKEVHAEEGMTTRHALGIMVNSAYKAGEDGNVSLLARITEQAERFDPSGEHIIRLPYRITPNSVLYWNTHTEMPGIATFNDKDDAADFYAGEVKKEGEYYGDN